ncbi:hypothetical protein AC138_22150 [Pseudomonas putida]|nr:hypothetical protein AC138_22150 [Pseudomonas putida]
MAGYSTATLATLDQGLPAGFNGDWTAGETGSAAFICVADAVPTAASENRPSSTNLATCIFMSVANL